MNPSGVRKRERAATSGEEYTVEMRFFWPMISRRASLKKAEVSGASIASPMRTRIVCANGKVEGVDRTVVR